MSLVTGLTWLVRRIWSSVHMGNFSPVRKLRFTVHMGNFSSVTEMKKVQSFKFQPGNLAGVFIWENF